MNLQAIAQRAVRKTLLATKTANPAAERAYRERLLKAYPAEVWEESEAQYQAAWRTIGNPPDQIGNFRRAGIVLQPKQLEFVYLCRMADYADGPTDIGFGGAQGPGKSFAVFTQIAVDDCQRFPGLKVLYLRKTASKAKEQSTDFVQPILQYVNCKPLETKISFPNGSRIVIGGYKDDTQALSYQGIEYDVEVIEECTQLSEHTYITLGRSNRSSKGWRPRIYSTTNPLGIGHQGYKRRFIDPARKGEQGKTRFVFATVDDNRFVNDEYEDKLAQLSGAEYRAFRLGDWDVAAGAYFETWRHDAHVIAEWDSIPTGWDVWLSSDYGFNHWNVVQLHTRSPDGVFYTLAELCHRKLPLERIIPDVDALLARYKLSPRGMNLIIGTDAWQQRGNASQTVAETWQASHYKVKKADTERVSGWHEMAKLLGDPDSGIAPRWFVAKSCHRLLETLPYLERDPNNAEDVRKRDADENGKGGDDAGDCARYGIVTRLKQFRFTDLDED